MLKFLLIVVLIFAGIITGLWFFVNMLLNAYFRWQDEELADEYERREEENEREIT